jgi:hypothetical protein
MTPASWEGAKPLTDGDGRGSTASRADADCSGLLAAADAALVVTLRAPPRSWLAARDCPQPVEFVATYPHPDCHRTFSDPGDAVGIALAVDEWHRSLPTDAVPAVCLADFDTLVEYAGHPDARRCLQVVTGRVRAAGGVVHCHDAGDSTASDSCPDTPAVPPERYLFGDASHQDGSVH